MSIDWTALGQVVVAGLIVGAGLPALFALGLRLVAGTGDDRPATGRTTEPTGPVVIARPSPLRMVGALLCFGTVVGAVAAGIVFIASGGH
ncbi:hypothetical protein ATJ88_3550 [Isoptericola jiangsuensis]|uniref:Uncharacterized protein n=1 Tax=Isoptericola jiangsuensis TaxID=548579 RepID=A0A2A9F1D5_9MICO|nr:hypothetical protein [Isoptericola jiangsuensis]PFG44813.1 hypothetical protein ATJ88_3550 [Isoptericola jiangsuensis]